jgi:hypothetical protein
MDQVTLVDNHYMTREFLESRLVENETRIKQLEEAHAQAVQRSYGESAERSRMRNEMQEWTLEQLSEGSLTESQAEDIASTCGFDLTTEVEVTVVVEYNMTMIVPAGQDAESIVNDIDFDAVTYDTDTVQYVSSMVTDIQI